MEVNLTARVEQRLFEESDDCKKATIKFIVKQHLDLVMRTEVQSDYVSQLLQLVALKVL